MYQEYEFTSKKFGLRLAKLRENKGVSARQMSLDIGQNKNYINSIEAGRNYPNMKNFFNICHFLNITPQTFFQEDDAPTSEHNEFLQIACSLPPQKFHHLYLLACDLQDEPET